MTVIFILLGGGIDDFFPVEEGSFCGFEEILYNKKNYVAHEDWKDVSSNKREDFRLERFVFKYAINVLGNELDSELVVDWLVFTNRQQGQNYIFDLNKGIVTIELILNKSFSKTFIIMGQLMDMRVFKEQIPK